MKWLMRLGIGSVGVSALSWVAVATPISEYVQVGWNRVSKAVKEAAPIGVDLERLELMLQQYDQELEANGRRIVEAQLQLERFEQELEASRQRVERGRVELGSVRDTFASATPDDRESLRSKLTTLLESQRRAQESLASMESVAQRKRTAFQELVAAHDRQRDERIVLADRVETLRTEYETLRMAGELEESPLVESAGKRAHELFGELSDKIEVQRRMGEMRENLASDLENRTRETIPADRLLAEVETLLEGDKP